MIELAVAATSYDRALAAALSLGDMARRITRRQWPESVTALIATIYTHTLYNNAPRETTGRHLSVIVDVNLHSRMLYVSLDSVTLFDSSLAPVTEPPALRRKAVTVEEDCT